MLEAKTECGCRNENRENRDEASVELLRGDTDLVATRLPDSSNVSCCGTTLTRREISGSDGAIQVRGLGQKLSLVATGSETGVATGCRCGPRGDAADAREHGESPLRINLLDGTPRNGELGDHVANHNSVITDQQDGSPECCPGGKSEGCCEGNAAHQSDAVERDNERCLCCAEDDPRHHTKDLTETGPERRHGLHRATEAAR
jgi:hypothetical protein